ncbi:glutathione S-transferase family protein [Oscillatoria sp. FACHB-1406]|uniref:glutathione S-transferase family protein n=1 Tax=Oscillatoria sp. FACHB-1406 TaxID=2692846 RepID=UPI001683CE91|nr:glutathione S-transferase family protein [Oscillatoria sp. FACHB-1406]MBD2577859.1 glutathione S-transferase family protein [Oscillatoria sp. FACHB-1406]
MLKLYGGARSRASIVRWYLEELEVPYEFVLLDMQEKEHHQPEFLAINPFGKVPAITDGDFKLWESGAILLYLAEKYGKLPDSSEKRAELAQWILFGNSTLATTLFVESAREREMERLLGSINTVLSERSFLMDEAFSAADVAVGSMLGYGKMMVNADYSAYPAVSEYVQRVTQRPAFIKAIASAS